MSTVLREHFIAIEGPIGVGKTTLMDRLAACGSLRTEREITTENPFLADFYADIPRWAFQTEMFFLTSRYTQLRDLGDDARGVISDFHIHKNLIFARRTLGPVELARLEAVHEILTDGLVAPDVTVFLDADLATLRRRIDGRARPGEALIEDRYLEDLREDYDAYHASLRDQGERTLRIDTAGLDLVTSPRDLALVRAQIEAVAAGRPAHPAKGTQRGSDEGDAR